MLTQAKLSTIGAYLFLTVPLLILVYLACLLFIRPPKKVLQASLLGGVVVALVNLVVDLIAYYAHWWHYDTKQLTELTLHLPLPFYVSPLLIFGSLGYLLIWRFWHGRLHWLSLVFLLGVPLFCIIRDVQGGLTGASYQIWDNVLMGCVGTTLMWVVAFTLGFLLFWRRARSVVPFAVHSADQQLDTDTSEEMPHHAR